MLEKILSMKWELEDKSCKSTYQVFFIRCLVNHTSYALKVFPNTIKARKDFDLEKAKYSLVAPCTFAAVKAIECIEQGPNIDHERLPFCV